MKVIKTGEFSVASTEFQKNGEDHLVTLTGLFSETETQGWYGTTVLVTTMKRVEREHDFELVFLGSHMLENAFNQEVAAKSICGWLGVQEMKELEDELYDALQEMIPC